MKIFDSHCHYNLPPLVENWQAHWQKAQEHGVEKAWMIGTNLETSQKALEIAQTDEKLSASIGISPLHYQEIKLATLEEKIARQRQNLIKLLEADQNNQIVAIGETGLDYYRLADDDQETREKQQAGFKIQLELANRYKKWLIVHARDKGGKEEQNNQAYWDVLTLVKEHYQHHQPFILHCLSGPAAYVKEAVKLGAYVGLAGNLTYPHSEHLKKLAQIAPKEKRFAETDAPYLAPQKYRGQNCEPWMIEETAQVLAQL